MKMLPHHSSSTF